MPTVFCSTTLILLAYLQITIAWSLKCFCGSYDEFVEVTADNVKELLTHPDCFSLTPVNGTIIYYHGFMQGSCNDNVTKDYIILYIRFGGKNVCLVNASQELAGPPIRYPIAAKNTLIVGKQVAVALCALFSAGLSLAEFRLVGLSLGAHAAGASGRWVTIYSGIIVTRITGVDPAGPLFQEPVHLARLTRNDARFVDIIHTDAFIILGKNYGIIVATGHVDIWVNFGFYRNGTYTQPGCPTGIYEPVTPPAVCSHERSLKLEGEALYKPYGLVTSYAPDYDTWVANDGAPIDVTPIGEMMNLSCLHGNHYMSTNGEPDFGRWMNGLRP